MRDGMDMMIASGTLMLILIAVIFYSIKPPTYTGFMTAEFVDVDIESFAKCIYKSGATLYISDNCERCEEQKNVFGENFEHLNPIECENTCERKDVTKFPTWVFKGKKYESVLSLKRISELTGCSVS